MSYVSRWLRPCNGAPHVKSTVASPRQAQSLQPVMRHRPACLPWRWLATMHSSAIVQGGCITTYQDTDRDNHTPPPTCTTPADSNTTRDSASIITRPFIAPPEQTPTSASRPNHGPTYAARWSPRRRAVRTVQACASGLVATPCRIYTTRYTDRLKVNPPWERVRSCSAL